MSQSDRAVKKLATEIARIRAEVKSWRGAQADFTSIENGGNFTFKDGDGNVTAIMGGQDDGSNTIRHVDGPTPPIPSGLSAHVDGPIVQVSWDGTFEDADTATYDWSHLEVIAVGPSNEQLTATINDVTGASTSVAATASGEWTVVARSVSRAEKRSLDGDAGTVTVELVGLTGAINDAIGSANGKNTVTYAEVAPTPADEGIVGDTWWVGMDGRPEEVLATNVAINPSVEITPSSYFTSAAITLNTFSTAGYQKFGARGARANVGSGAGAFTYVRAPQVTLTPGAWTGSSLWMYGDAGSKWVQLRIWFYNQSGGSLGIHSVTPIQLLPGEWTQVAGTVQTPVGAVTAYPYFYIYNDAAGAAPVSGSRVRFDGWSVVSANSHDDALAAVANYFDGDTADGSSDNDPHYRWTGTPHVSTSEMFLPAIGSGVWSIVEQYQYTSSGWLPVELNHEVIASVDLGKATVGELDGIRIMGQTVRGEQLSGDAIDGKVITGGTYRTSGGTGSWSDAGLFIAQPDGTSMVRFPTDGSPLSLTASDTQIERASITDLDLSYGAVRSGGEFTLASGVTAPASPPELSAGWKFEAKLPRPAEPSMDWTGLAYWNGLYVRGVNVLGSAGDSADRIELYNPDGSLNRSINIDLNPRAGVAVIGDIVYTIGPDHVASNAGKQWCHGFNLNTGERVSRWEYVHFFAAKQQKISIGVDGSNLLVAGVAPNSVLHVFKYNPSTGAQVGAQLTDTGWNLRTQEIFGAQQVGSDIYITHRGFTRVYTVTGATMSRKPGGSNGSNWAGWKNPNENAGGTTFVDGAPLVADSGAVYQGSAAESDYTNELCFTWYDGTHETTASPVSVVDVAARETVTVSLPVRAGLQKRLYSRPVGGGTNWARGTVAADVTVAPVPVGVPSFAPPSTNSFPNAAPAVFRSTNGNVVVRGDGSGHWGPLTFNADGTMTSAQIPAWVPVTTFASGFGPQSWGFAPAYRVWPDGKVEWRGVISGAFDLTGNWKNPFTMPVAARPPWAVNMAAGATGAAGQSLLKRVEFSPTADASEFRVYSGDSNSTWVSLEGLYYYLT